MSRAAFVTIHGMGKTDTNYASVIFRTVRKLLREDAEKLAYVQIYYDGPLQKREDDVMGDMLAAQRMRWGLVREIAIYGLADAVALETHRGGATSDYFVAQKAIAEKLLEASRTLESTRRPVVILGHSLGCQVLSNYIWDAQHSGLETSAPTTGIWADVAATQRMLGATKEEMEFLKLGNLSSLITTGCNIPVFVAAVAREDIIPINEPNTIFEWHNFFDLDDVLGYPLRPLSKPYEALVRDHEVSVGNWLKGWNPASHFEYWSDDDVLNPLIDHLKQAINLPDFP